MPSYMPSKLGPEQNPSYEHSFTNLMEFNNHLKGVQRALCNKQRWQSCAHSLYASDRMEKVQIQKRAMNESQEINPAKVNMNVAAHYFQQEVRRLNWLLSLGPSPLKIIQMIGRAINCRKGH